MCLTHRPPPPGKPHHLADPGYACCAACYQRIHSQLSPLTVDASGHPDSVPGLYALLSPTPGTGHTGRRQPGYGSRSPADDHVIAMRDHRTVRDPYTTAPLSVDPHSVPGVLTSWVGTLADARGFTPPTDRSVAGLCRFLDASLDWITRQTWVDDFAAELRDLRIQLRVRRREFRRVGDCPTFTDAGRCGVTLLVPLAGGTIHCWGCRAWWTPDEWLHLGALLTAG